MAELLEYLSEKYPQKSVDEVNRRLLELSSLFEISQLLNESLELERVLNNVLLIPMGRLMIPRGAILLRRKEKYRVVMAKGLSAELAATEFKPDQIPEEALRAAFQCQEGSAGKDAFSSFMCKARLKISMPFTSNNQCLGLLLFGAKLASTDFSEEETSFLMSLANLSATTVENALQLNEIKEVNRQLDGKIQELKTLFDIGQGLSSTLDYEQILKLLIYALMGQMLVNRYVVYMRREDTYVVHDHKGLEAPAIEALQGQLQALPAREAPLLTRKCRRAQLRKLTRRQDLQVLIPLSHQKEQLGYIFLGPKLSGSPYSVSDLEFLSTLVSQAVISLENARLFQETLEKQKMEDELNVARRIQKNLLPGRFPSPPGYEIYGMNQSSRQVGGDYFDVIEIDQNRLALAIGDVTGKGVPASLLMANLQAALRITMTPEADLAQVVGRLNQLIHANTESDKFITFFIGILNTAQHTFEYVNAGHNNPHWIHGDGGRQSFLDVGGVLLGVVPEFPYQCGKIQLQENDFIFIYTDGVNEALNPQDEEFGDPRLNELTRTLVNCSAREIVERVWSEIDTFSGGRPQADDVTMLTVRRLPQSR